MLAATTSARRRASEVFTVPARVTLPCLGDTSGVSCKRHRRGGLLAAFGYAEVGS
jgi:hypothetical protein